MLRIPISYVGGYPPNADMMYSTAFHIVGG